MYFRAKAEDDYGKTLIRIAQQASGIEEMGSLGEAWNSLRKGVQCRHCKNCFLVNLIISDIAFIGDSTTSFAVKRLAATKGVTKICTGVRRIQKVGDMCIQGAPSHVKRATM